MNELPKRKRLRLNGYDYSQMGVYFVTMCVEKREPILGCIREGDGILNTPQVELTEYGKIVAHRIGEMNQVYRDIQIEKFVIMPNHIHMIVSIRNADSRPTGENGFYSAIRPVYGHEPRAVQRPAPTAQRLPLLVSTLKRFTNKSAGFPFWQRGYHEHIVRDEYEYQILWRYTDDNPKMWLQDRYYNEPGAL